jgi:hypothetical protein
MVETQRESFIAECFWPGVHDSDLAALDGRIEGVIAELGADRKVQYRGSLLLRQDEVVLCQFEGHSDTVRDVAERAEIPFERILAAAHSPWPLSRNGGTG